jgi:hypothetical protein
MPQRIVKTRQTDGALGTGRLGTRLIRMATDAAFHGCRPPPHAADTGAWAKLRPSTADSRRLRGSIASLRLYQSLVTMREYSQEEIT